MLESFPCSSNDVMLRYSLALCQEEKTFKEVRKEKVFYNMQQILGDKAPQTLKEVSQFKPVPCPKRVEWKCYSVFIRVYSGV